MSLRSTRTPLTSGVDIYFMIRDYQLFLFKVTLWGIAVLAFVFFLTTLSVEAQGDGSDRMSLAVTPPLFQTSVVPGQSWSSSVRIINSNPYPLEIYATPVNFSARAEDGTPRFSPLVVEDGEAIGAAGWLRVNRGPYLVPAEDSLRIDFTVAVPETAPPGGHYAAILVGTEPVGGASDGSVIRVSSLVTSLLLLRVEGDILESGRIREFRTDSKMYQRPEARFLLRFENQGNVHLRPRGVIEIENMWGQNRGQISINKGGGFGNVLPDSVRSFSFNWSGEWSPLEIGRYRAVATLAYGESGQRHAGQEIFFWVLPVWPLVITLAVVSGSLFLLVVSIRLYIRRALSLERRQLQSVSGETYRQPPSKIKVVSAPIRDGVIDMKRTLKERHQRGSIEVIKDLVGRYYMTAVALLALLALLVVIYLFAQAGLTEERGFEFEQDFDNRELVR